MKRLLSYCLILLHTLAFARVLVPVEEIAATKTGVQALATVTIVGTLKRQGGVNRAAEGSLTFFVPEGTLDQVSVRNQAGEDINLVVQKLSQRRESVVLANGKDRSVGAPMEDFAGRDLNIFTEQAFQFLGVEGKTGRDLNLDLGGKALIASVTEEKHRSVSWDDGWQEQHQITHTRTTLKAGRELNATFREDAVIAGLKAEAGEMIKINAQKDVLSLGVENLDHTSHLVKSGGGLFGSRSREEVSRTRLESLPDAFKAPLSLMNSEGNLLNQGTQYQGKAVLQAKGKASLQSSETLVEETKVCQSSSLVWQKTRSQGTIHKTYRPVAATEGLTVRANTLALEFPKGQEIPENLTIEELPTPLLEGPSKQPTEPLHLEVKHPQEVHEHWEQSQQGLTAGAAAVLGLAVTLATGTPLGNFAGGLTGATQGFAYAATKAGMQAVASATVVGTVNHQGNAGRAVEDLGKPDSLRSIAASMVTAGLVENVTQTLKLPDAPKTFGEHFQKAAIKAAVSVPVNMTLGGVDPDKAF
ncbi:MAG: DUF637 domain-containing protein, partial [Alphaproteobacteria bacterium]